jgi:pilus assembly protein CpaB
MSRGTRTLIVLAVAVIAATAASYSVYRAVLGMPAHTVEVATRNAVVAKKGLPVGTLLTRDSVKVVQWPEKTPVTGGFADMAEVVDRGLVSAVVENEPITESKLAPKSAGAGLPPTITPGMRAIAVRVNEVIGVAGFVGPGTHVDVMTIISRTKDEPMSRVVVSNVQVLAAGTRTDLEEGKEGKAIRSTVVTLMVSPLDAERIALAQTEGQIMLTLRHPLDVDQPETTGVTRGGLFGAPPAPAAPTVKPVTRRVVPSVEPPPAPVVAVVQPIRVETIKGMKRSLDTLTQETPK